LILLKTVLKTAEDGLIKKDIDNNDKIKVIEFTFNFNWLLKLDKGGEKMLRKCFLIVLLIILFSAIATICFAKELSSAEMGNIDGGAGKVGCTTWTWCGGGTSYACYIQQIPGGYRCIDGRSRLSITDCGSGTFNNCAHLGNPVPCIWKWKCQLTLNSQGQLSCVVIAGSGYVADEALNCKAWN